MGGTDVLNIVIAAIFAIEVALGLTIIFGVMRVINMAHGEFFMLGAYTMVVVTGAGLNPWLGIALAPVLLGMFGILTERTMIRPLYRRADLSSLLATFGLSIVLQQSARLVFGPQSRSVPTPLEGNLNILGTTYPAYRLLAAAIALAVIVAVGALVYRSTFGVRMRATMENTEVASALGTNTSRIAGWAFGLGARQHHGDRDQQDRDLGHGAAEGHGQCTLAAADHHAPAHGAGDTAHAPGDHHQEGLDRLLQPHARDHPNEGRHQGPREPGQRRPQAEGPAGDP